MKSHRAVRIAGAFLPPPPLSLSPSPLLLARAHPPSPPSPFSFAQKRPVALIIREYVAVMLSIPPANSNRAHPPTWWIPGRKSGRTPCNPSISVLVVAVNGAQVQGHVRERERVRETGRERKRGREREREGERKHRECLRQSISRARSTNRPFGSPSNSPCECSVNRLPTGPCKRSAQSAIGGAQRGLAAHLHPPLGT